MRCGVWAFDLSFMTGLGCALANIRNGKGREGKELVVWLFGLGEKLIISVLGIYAFIYDNTFTAYLSSMVFDVWVRLFGWFAIKCGICDLTGIHDDVPVHILHQVSDIPRDPTCTYGKTIKNKQ